ncbi:iron-containing alcohol dehydrogenase [Agrobacterium sp. MS2]|uniref:iron-containing alcohol dehydrogenase n=1 Tax=Agrobacterium sp. MS2 TaxID=1345498 RepID=UPI000DB6CC84|nr:iron-containing alcohol dehydrogenase [Agrobacterium sp. MS2]PZP70901.1 MAG: 4-hydroxybutyrate dehydrogenase [Delftia acidovorans]RAL97316.1 4-hydroxybutyrate dehydrogenase [Agrobacterium sp. MS2]
MSLINYLTRIQFDFGASSLISEELSLLGVSRPLIVTDVGIVKAGLIEKIKVAAGLSANTPLYDGTPENPDENAVLKARDQFLSEGCDSIIAVGGGSSLDLAKAVSLLATHHGALEQYAAILGGIGKITRDKPPVVAVPTTSGTGSEVGRAALITLNDGRKLGFISPYMIPEVAICDPDLTLGLPAYLTAATGMDAVTHCIETFLSPRENAPAEAIALDGLARAVRYLERAVKDGGDREARREMMMASLEGGLTFQKGLGAVHGMSHALGGLKPLRLHHGTLNAVILPSVLRFNEPYAEEKYGRLRIAMGLADGADVAEAIERLSQSLGLPSTLGEMGVHADSLPLMVDRAMADHSTATNARPVSAEDYAALFRTCMGSGQ